MDIIKFEGLWSCREQERVQTAVGHAEKALNLEVPESLMGKRWICRRELEDGRPVYIASRVNLTPTLSAGSASELTAMLELLARGSEPSSERPARRRG